MNGGLEKHSVTLFGHTTSISLESEFWDELKDIAKRQQMPLSKLIADIDSTRKSNLSSALRVFILTETKKRT